MTHPLKKILYVLVLLNLTICAWAENPPLSVEELFHSANYFYRNEDYAAAIKIYESILSLHKESGALYYNLGNAYFRSGSVAKAVLNYERAKRFIPRDSDLRYNERYVNGRIPYPDTPSGTLFERLLTEFLDFYTLDELVKIVVIGLIIFGLLVLAQLFPKWNLPWGKMFAMLAIAFFCFFICASVLKYNTQRNWAVMMSDSEAKFEPRADATGYFQLFAGHRIKVIREEGQWIKIKREDGKLGWVLKEKLEMI